MNNELRFIHLLYVPTMNCNMQCKYCYLKENTVDLAPDDKYLHTLQYAIDKFRQSNVVPFNVSLHGGEVTTLSKEDFRNIIEYIANYYKENKDIIEENGFKTSKPHIKTNMLNLEKHIETIKEFGVSISGSLDIPFSLHDEYRVTKGNKKTLDTILSNIALLKDLPNHKKVSATIFKEHFDRIDEMVEDIKFLEKNTCLDMNDFNFMIGFNSSESDMLTPMSEENQVALYQRMQSEFRDTTLDEGVRNNWFAEFGPTYCTNCDNCGEKFFLLERNGDIYSCVRGQKHEEFYYGNIFEDSVEAIMANAKEKILKAHNRVGFNEDCAQCKYLYMCKTGCPFVKNVYNSDKSYTCQLQHMIYKDNEEQFPMDEFNEENVYRYTLKMHTPISSKYYPENINSDMPSLKTLIMQDEKLRNIYSDDIFVLKVDGTEYRLESQVLKNRRDTIYLSDESRICLYIKHGVLEDCEYPANNSLYMILLSGDMVVYGDEHRNKQEHVMTHQIYTNTIRKYESDREGYYCIDITKILSLYYDVLSKEWPNNLFFTTSQLRDYHYTKQKNNAYYHIQAINLPFQNIEFEYIDMQGDY